jgi:hypothetical protein
MRVELVHLRHQVEYYQDTTQVVRFMRTEFEEIYTQFKSDREVFMTRIVSYQEETLLGLIAYKEMMRWSEKAHQVLAQIEYIREIQKGRGEEEHGIRMLADESLVRIRVATKYWVQLVVEPQQKMQEIWEECLRNWNNINQRMIYLQLPEFDAPDDFVDLHIIVQRFESSMLEFGVNIWEI